MLLFTLILLLLPVDVHATPPIGGNTVEFADSGQNLGSADSLDVVLGDVDGDGDLDAFVTNYGQANKVWVNDGSGVFSDSGQSLGSANSFDVALGDVDADGDLDAFVVNYDGQANTVWTNDGSGNFSDSGQSLGNFDSADVALADIDSDGDLDAFVANYNGQANKVWINNGSGSFSDSGQNLGSSVSRDVALGDVDGDGDLDAVVANVGQPNRVWTNDGSGNFSDSAQNLGSANSVGIALGDLDGDGDLDAFVANYGQGNVVWTNDGGVQGGTLGTFTDSGQNLGNSSSTDVALADLDSDGDLDAVVANAVGQANKVWTNNGSGVFNDSGQNLGSSESVGVALGDLDSDGDLDAVVANFNGQANKVWTNNGVHRNAPFVDSGQSLGQHDSEDVALGDVDGDGDLDAFVANTGIGSTGSNQVLTNDGSGIFSDSGQSLGNSDSRAVALGDVDGDGDLDAFVVNFRRANKLWVNNGSGIFSDSGQNLGDGDSIAVALGDVDGDGDLDAVVANFNQANKVWTNDGSGVFSDSGQNLGSSYSRDVALGDVDGDGDLDAVFANYSQGNKVWTNDGSGVFSDSGQSLGSANSLDVALGDVDGDGDLDAVFANYFQANKVWINDGGAQRGTLGSFSDSGQNLGSFPSWGVALGDVDGDGDLDAVVANSHANSSQPNRIWSNDGSGVFSDSGQSLGSSGSRSVDLGDIDGDGDLDAVVANKLGPVTGPSNKMWINQGGSAGLAVTDTALGSSIPNSSEDDLMKVVFSHNGKAADHDLELHTWTLNLFRDDCNTALTSAEANAIIENLRVRLDDGDDSFETDGSDALVMGGDIDTLNLTGGVQTITFSNDDTDVQVDQNLIPTRTYWISVLTTADADQQDPSGFCVRFDPDADVLVEGKTPDFSVSIADTAPTDALVTPGPLAVTLSYFLAQALDGEVHFVWQTATETGIAGFNLFAVNDSGSVKLNDELIPSPAIDSLQPNTYEFTTNTDARSFLLHEVGLDGQMSQYGPFDLGIEFGIYVDPGGNERGPAIWLPIVVR